MTSVSKRPASKARRFHQLLEGDVSDPSTDMIEWRTPAAPRRNLGFAPPKPPAPRKENVDTTAPVISRPRVVSEVDEPGSVPEREQSPAALAASITDAPPDESIDGDGDDPEGLEDAAPRQGDSAEDDDDVLSSSGENQRVPDQPYAERSMYAADSDVARAAYSSRNATPGKPFGCSVNHCKKTFTRRGDLLRHYRIHTEDRPWVCEECGRRFIQRSALTVHTRVHTGERPHSCEVCARKFSDSSSLARHRRIHTGVRPYACEHCNKSYCRKVTLSKHYNKCHHPQRFALEHEALKAMQTASNARRCEKLVRSAVDPQQTQQKEAAYQGRARTPSARDEPHQRDAALGPVRLRLSPDVAPHERRRVPSAQQQQGCGPISSAHDRGLSRGAHEASFERPATTMSTWAHDPAPTIAAYAPRYALDVYGQAYEIDEYGNSTGVETVHHADLPPLGAYHSAPSHVAPQFSPSPPARYSFNDPALRYIPRPYQYHPHAPMDPRSWTPDEYAAQYARSAGASGGDWHHVVSRPLPPRAHASGDSGNGWLPMGADWQTGPYPPAPSSFYGPYRLPNPAQHELRVGLSVPDITHDRGFRGSATNASVPHVWDQNNSSPAFPMRASTSEPRMTSPSDGERWSFTPAPWSQGPVAMAPLPVSRFSSSPAPPERLSSGPRTLVDCSQAETSVALSPLPPSRFLPSPLATTSRPPSSLNKSRRAQPVSPGQETGRTAVESGSVGAPSLCPPHRTDRPRNPDPEERESPPSPV
ncbi:hypothetical protein JCM3774_001874 [Rhodotorula dairenensis]